MPQQPVTRNASVHRRSATAQHGNHARTHHTTPSRSRGGTGVTATFASRSRNPELARAAMVDFVV